MTATDDLTEARRRNAQYAGCISRWCALTGNVPDATKAKNVSEVELNTFRKFLDNLATGGKAEKPKPSQRMEAPSWNF